MIVLEVEDFKIYGVLNRREEEWAAQLIYAMAVCIYKERQLVITWIGTVVTGNCTASITLHFYDPPVFESSWSATRCLLSRSET